MEDRTYDVEGFAAELEEAATNRDIGTTLWFENDHVRVWEVRLEPGQRAPFHNHSQTYFWTCIDAGKGFQRFPDGTAEPPTGRHGKACSKRRTLSCA